MFKTTTKPVSRKANVVVQESGNEVLIYDLIENRAFNLNETSAFVWQACDGNNTVGDIANQISRKMKSPINEDFVWLALQQLKKENLIENDLESAMPFDGLSRREVIRRVGFASMVALPIVSSLIAPTAIQAGSNCGAATGRANGCVCQGAANCASNCCGRTTMATNACVTAGQDAPNSPCRANCECASNSCNGTTNVCN